ncbi:nicotinate (nicotinamide) nucleotide adenylyltransferase [Methylophilaceae bacterium]|nr:nicotinate (nicotinamide) nucleotide adenylyltransferase [Methylophilaceae bacterium]
MKLDHNLKSMPLVGLFGGAYDPIHNGHLMIADSLINKLKLDQFFFIPTGISVNNKNLTSANHRLNMIRLALTNSKLNVSTYETDNSLNEEKSYTIDTLKYFFEKNNAINFFIMGSDNFLKINTWKNWEKLLNYAHIILVDRKISSLSFINDSEIKEFLEQHEEENFSNLKLKRNGYIYKHQIDYIDIASSEIRERIYQGKKVSNVMPEKIKRYIAANNLYKSIGQVT